jgi:monoamine oxidase
VVGGGLAGLTCAYRLRQAGVTATVHEASTRLGGRCWTGRGEFADGQIYEHGGELIDNGHLEIKHLVQELGLTLDNLFQAEAGTEVLGNFFGSPYTAEQMSDDLKVIWSQVHKDTSAASYPTLYNLSTPRGRELDQMSIRQWIEAYVPGGMGSNLGRLLDVAYNIEYGAETTDQSSLNLLYLLGYIGPGQFRVFGKSNEKFHVRGGNDQIVTRLAAGLPGQIKTSSELIAIKKETDGTYTLTFKQGAKKVSVGADHVVLALPFTILRSSVDWSKAGFSSLKATAIREQGMGTNSKLHVQFTSRFWTGQGLNGETFSDRSYQNTWEVSRAQPGASGILVNYTGGNAGLAAGSGTPASQAAAFLPSVEPVLPGATAAWNGRVTRDYWTGNPWTKGSYSYWKVGQYTKFAGVEGERSGNCHFAGEHTSIDFIGYLNGGVETGERAADEILADLK